jgi:hypothetical protein
MKELDVWMGLGCCEVVLFLLRLVFSGEDTGNLAASKMGDFVKTKRSNSTRENEERKRSPSFL